MDVEKSQISNDDMEDASKFAGELDVNHEIHPDDFIFHFLVTNPVFEKRSDAIRYYFYDGNKSAKILRDLIGEIGIDADDEFSLLEFASGYGCVTRSMPKFIPKLKLLCSDIHQEAIDFTQNIIKQKSIISSKSPETLEIQDVFDVVFALSFFSHMPRDTWLRWLLALYARVSPGGHLIFTTQGRKTAETIFGDPSIPEDGFWFSAQSEQKDIDVSEYGQTVVTKEFVYKQITYLPSADIVIHRPSFWWSHQDLYVIQRKL